MRKTISFIFALLFVPSAFFAQNILVSGAVVGNGVYSTLTDAFAGINSGAQTGASIIVGIFGNTNEGSGSAILYPGTWSSITVYPSGGARTITGAAPPGQALITFAGADRVYFSGMLSGNVPGLTISNTTVSSVTNTSTLLFYNDATQINFSYCNILGSSLTDYDTWGGTICFASGNTITGNDDINITFCNIGPAGTNLPNKAVCSKGDLNNYNSGITVSHCNIYDYSSTGLQRSAGIVLDDGNLNWNITVNRFYQTAHRHITTSFHNDILLNSYYGNYGHVINANVFGYANSAGTGVSSFSTNNSLCSYIPIHVPAADDISFSTITNNTIAGISLLATNPGNHPVNFCGIFIQDGNMAVSGTTIGSSTVPGNISMTNLYTADATFSGIVLNMGPGGAMALNNTVGGIQLDAPNGGSISFTGIRGQNVQTINTNQMTNNQIGFAAAPIVVNASGTAGRTMGIYLEGSPAEVSGNTVAYISSRTSHTGVSLVSGLMGIYVHGTSASDFVNNNRVFALESTHPSAPVNVVGIFAMDMEINSRNLVHSLSAVSPNGKIEGIHLGSVPGSFSNNNNNMVRLGRDRFGQSISTDIKIIGIYEDVGFMDLFFNSVYIGGDNVSGTDSTYAFYGIGSNTNRKWRNNIFFNGRSNGNGTGCHYAVYATTMISNTSPSSNGNDFYVSGNGGRLAYIYGQECLTLPAWRTLSGVDLNSISSDPLFINPNGDALMGDLHIGPASPIEAAGQVYAAIASDYDNQARSSRTPVDIGADALITQALPPSTPEILVLGNSLSIVDGDMTPSATDHTDFGLTGCGSAGQRSFILENTGNAPLIISSYGLSGPGASQFSIVTPPPGVIQGGQSVTITLVFHPWMAGLSSAQFNLSCNDWDETFYSFAIQASSLGDTIAPTAVCSPTLVYVNAAGNGIVNAQAFGAGSTDNCGISSYFATPNVFNCSQPGPHTVQLYVTDHVGLQDMCSGSVQVVDSTRPTALCRNFSASLDINGQLNLLPSDFNNGSTDNCGIDSLWASAAHFTCAQIGSNAVTLHVRDTSGNVGSCVSQLIVSETVPPNAVCQPVTLILDAQGQASLSPSAVDGGSTDNCSITGISLSMSQFDCGQLGLQLITLNVTDASGNTGTCTAQVTVQDTIAPDLVCQNTSVNVGSSGSTPLTVSLANGSDNCGIDSLFLSQSEFDCSDTGSVPVTVIAMDATGNATSCIAYVQVNAVPLSVGLVADTFACGHALQCSGTQTGVAHAGVQGGCEPYSYLWSNGATQASATGLGAGPYTVTVTDANGHSSTATVQLTEPLALNAAIQITHVPCPGSTGSLDVQASGGADCQPYSYLWSNGATTASVSGVFPGPYTVTVTDAGGCMSVALITLSSLPAPQPQISQVLDTLFCSPAFISYQWLLNGQLIPGAFGPFFVPTVPGLYQVVVADTNGCTGNSTDFLCNGTAISDPGTALAMTIFPNPTNGRLVLRSHLPIQAPLRVALTDLSGRMLADWPLPQLLQDQELDLQGLAAGVYLLQVTVEDGGRQVFRVVVE